MAETGSTSELYRSVVGSSWDRLDPGVRRLHGRNGTVQRGRFRVRRGGNWLARAVAAILRFPPEGDAVDCSLLIASRGGRESWRRVFGGNPLASEQYRVAGGLLVERGGPVELHFRLEIERGALVFKLVEARFFGFRLPARLQPRVSGREWGADVPSVAIRAEAPVLGLLVAYEGTME